MNNERLEFLQHQIEYRFKEPNLLIQAFTRKSYTEEHKDCPHNEVLEFYGDKALEFIVMKKLYAYFGKCEKNGKYHSEKTEGELTEIKQKLICRSMLASKIKALALETSFLMGKGDYEQKVWEQESVQEDLFEAIIGAVAIDSEWNESALTNVIDRMLDPEYYFENGFEENINYVQFIQEWCQKNYNSLPSYGITDYISTFRLAQTEPGSFECRLAVPGLGLFNALGQNKNKARMAAAKKAYDCIIRQDLVRKWGDEIGEACRERAINQLQELYQKGYIGEPRYDFEEASDANGNINWVCWCYVNDYRHFAWHSSKKEAKKDVAFEILKRILNQEECRKEVCGQARFLK